MWSRRRARCGSRPPGDAETGGALLVFDLGEEVNAMAFFVRDGRAATDVRVFDPVGGEALA